MKILNGGPDKATKARVKAQLRKFLLGGPRREQPLVVLRATIMVLAVVGGGSYMFQYLQHREAFIHEVDHLKAGLRHAAVSEADYTDASMDAQRLWVLTSSDNSGFMQQRYRDRAADLVVQAELLDDLGQECRELEEASVKKLEECEKTILDSQGDLQEARNQRKHDFAVIRKFDVVEGGLGTFEATDMTSYEKVVLIASDDDVKLDGTWTSLYVDDEGLKPVMITHSNAFQHYQTTEYYRTYKANSTQSSLETNERDLDRAQREEAVARDKVEIYHRKLADYKQNAKALADFL